MLRSIALCTALALGLAAQEPQKFEMTTYFVAFLKKGPAWTPQSTPETKKLQEGHMANIQKMHALGKLVLAGPFSDGGDLRGMFVFQTATLEEAQKLAAEDPAVKAGRLAYEWHPWYSAKGIGIVQDGQKK